MSSCLDIANELLHILTVLYIYPVISVLSSYGVAAHNIDIPFGFDSRYAYVVPECNSRAMEKAVGKVGQQNLGVRK